ncbi:MAG: hypothetical protein KDJ38_20020 [Gammaproteobacteria bacterium]|nr:hypothetical protein [Gammaproteobacteria bacterium]
MTSVAEKKDYDTVTKCQTIASVLWPSFIIAGIANSLFWVFVDPHDLGMITGFTELSRTGAYSLGFIFLWATTALSSFFTQLFCKPCNQVNKKSL